jgi:hypothetical protein
MNQSVEKITTNGNAQNESTVLPTTKEGFEAPSPEVKAPFLPGKKRTERDKWKAILVGVALLAVIAVAAHAWFIHMTSPATMAGKPSRRFSPRADSRKNAGVTVCGSISNQK